MLKAKNQTYDTKTRTTLPVKCNKYCHKKSVCNCVQRHKMHIVPVQHHLCRIFVIRHHHTLENCRLLIKHRLLHLPKMPSEQEVWEEEGRTNLKRAQLNQQEINLQQIKNTANKSTVHGPYQYLSSQSMIHQVCHT